MIEVSKWVHSVAGPFASLIGVSIWYYVHRTKWGKL